MSRVICLLALMLPILGACPTSRADDPPTATPQQRIKKLQLAVHNLIVESEYECNRVAQRLEADKKFFKESADIERQRRIEVYVEEDNAALKDFGKFPVAARDFERE